MFIVFYTVNLYILCIYPTFCCLHDTLMDLEDVCVCVCVCVYVCMHACVYVCMYVYITAESNS